MLPMMRKIADDELFTTWLQDIMEMNHMTSNELYEVIFQSRKSKLHPFYPSGIEEFCKKLSDMVFTPGLHEILEKHTDLYASLSFMGAGMATRYFEYALRSSDTTYGTGFHLFPKIDGEYHYCPECMQDDIKRYGKPLTHVCHNLLGVKTCWKHGCVLCDEMGNPLWNNVRLDIEKRVTAYYKALYDTPVISYLEQTKVVIMQELKMREITFTQAVKLAERDGYLDASMRVRQEYTNDVRLRNRNLGRLLCYLIPDVNDFRNRVEPYECGDISSNDFTVMEHGNVIERYKCKHCGYEFYRHPEGVRIGLPCPKCNSNRSMDEQMEIYLQQYSDYEFADGERYSKIRHRPCGCEKHLPKTFMFYGISPCSTCVSRDVTKWQQVFEDTDYTVKNVVHKRDDVIPEVLLKHKTCGCEFTIRGYDYYFKKNLDLVHCPNCEPMYVKSIEARQRNGLYKVGVYGVGMKIIEYRGSRKVLVRFDNGLERWMNWETFDKGCEKIKEAHIGEVIKNRWGDICKVIDYKNNTNVTVECNGRKIQCTYRCLLRGNVR